MCLPEAIFKHSLQSQLEKTVFSLGEDPLRTDHADMCNYTDFGRDAYGVFQETSCCFRGRKQFYGVAFGCSESRNAKGMDPSPGKQSLACTAILLRINSEYFILRDAQSKQLNRSKCSNKRLLLKEKWQISGGFFSKFCRKLTLLYKLRCGGAIWIF